MRTALDLLSGIRRCGPLRGNDHVYSSHGDVTALPIHTHMSHNNSTTSVSSNHSTLRRESLLSLPALALPVPSLASPLKMLPTLLSRTPKLKLLLVLLFLPSKWRRQRWRQRPRTIRSCCCFESRCSNYYCCCCCCCRPAASPERLVGGGRDYRGCPSAETSHHDFHIPRRSR